MGVDTSIFKAYDIRGVYPDQLNEELAYKIGAAFAWLLIKENPEKKLKVIVSRDMRLSSPNLSVQVLKAITDLGVDVVDSGFS